MKSKPLLIGWGLSLFLAAGAFFLQSQKIRELEAELAKLGRELASRQEQVVTERVKREKLSQENEIFQSEAEQLRGQLAGRVGGESKPEAGSPAKEEGGDPFFKGLAKMFRDPEMKKSMRAQQLTMIQIMYADLAKELGLSADEASQLMEMLADRQSSMTEESMSRMGAAKDPQKMEEMSKVLEARRKEFDQQMKSFLGPEKSERFEKYEKTIGERMQIQQIQQGMMAKGVGLEEVQRQQLLGIMSEERSRQPESAFGPGKVDIAAQMKTFESDQGIEKLVGQTQETNQRVLVRARGVLSPDQMNALEAAQNQSLDQLKAGMKMSREMMGKGK